MRYRGIATTGISQLGAGGLSLWWSYHIAGMFFLGALSFAGLLFYMRLEHQRRIKADNCFHSFFHELRDELPVALAEKPGSKDRAKQTKAIYQGMVQTIADYFCHRKKDDQINCALRILHEDDTFVTRARSSGLDKSRKQRSQPIPLNKGLANHLRANDAHGVFLIDSIDSAIEGGIWMPTATDGLKDVKKLMVCPVNTVENGSRAMIGILYVTSADNSFGAQDSLPLKAFADAIGMALALLLSDLSSQPLSRTSEEISNEKPNRASGIRTPSQESADTGRKVVGSQALRNAGDAAG